MRAVAQPTLRVVISRRPTAELNQSSKMLIIMSPSSLSFFESSLLKQPQDPSEHRRSGSRPASRSVQFRSPGAQSLSGFISSSSITDGLKHPTCPATQSLSGKSSLPGSVGAAAPTPRWTVYSVSSSTLKWTGLSGVTPICSS